MANSTIPVRLWAHYEPSYLDLHCLYKYLLALIYELKELNPNLSVPENILFGFLKIQKGKLNEPFFKGQISDIHISKTRLFKYFENFTTKNENFQM